MTKKNMRNLINKIMESENTITYTDYIGRLICSLCDDSYDHDEKNEIREHVRKLFNNCLCTDYNTILINIPYFFTIFINRFNNAATNTFFA